jgi:hypothetical protein
MPCSRTWADAGPSPARWSRLARENAEEHGFRPAVPLSAMIAGLYDGPFSWENMFGFHLAGMVGHDFFKSYAVTFDFENVQISIRYRGRSLSCMP